MHVFFTILFIFCICSRVEAYSTSKYSIDIPSTYKKATEGSFTKANGSNVNVQITPFLGSSINAFTEEELNNLTRNINSGIDDLRDEMKKNIKERYGEYLSDSEINEYVKFFKCNSIDKKEITTATKNNYKCYHIIANYLVGDYNYYAEQYSFISNNNVYTLTACVEEKSYLQSSEIRNIVNSFTITNYKDPEKSFLFSSDIWTKIIATVIVATIGVAIKHFVDKGKQKDNAIIEDNSVKYEEDIKLEKDNKKGFEIEKKEADYKSKEIIGDKENLKQDKKYCTKCGEEIEEDWDFCNHCGNKLK